MLLDRVSEQWPAEIHELALVGHSSGGLICRSACHYGAGSEWAAKVRHVFTLGAPHRGTPLEQLTQTVSTGLRLLPETRAFANALEIRSAGVKDLGRGGQVPFLSTANHYFVSGALSRDPDAPLARLVGDMFVLRSSAWSHGGPGERVSFPVERYRQYGGVSHFELLNHPAVYAQIRAWLTSRRALPAPA